MAGAKTSAAAAPRRAPPSAKAAVTAAWRGLLPLVADAVLLGLVSALWAAFATNAAGWAFGGCSLAGAVAGQASRAAFLAAWALFPLASPLLLLLLLLRRTGKDRSQTREFWSLRHFIGTEELQFTFCKRLDD